MTALRKCRDCGKEAFSKNELELFRKRRTHKYGRENLCKECDSKRSIEYIKNNKEQHQEAYYQRNYGVSLSDINNMLEEQNNKCAICGTDGSENQKNFHVDHCHTTGKVRGILCHRCNTALGLFKDDIDVMFNAIKYLGE